MGLILSGFFLICHTIETIHSTVVIRIRVKFTPEIRVEGKRDASRASYATWTGFSLPREGSVCFDVSREQTSTRRAHEYRRLAIIAN